VAEPRLCGYSASKYPVTSIDQDFGRGMSDSVETLVITTCFMVPVDSGGSSGARIVLVLRIGRRPLFTHRELSGC
jgi:hypothetical protein